MKEGEGQHRIAVIGDVMRDVTIEVAVDRVSPEAPCLIGRHLSETHTAGGAGNVAANIRALAGDDVTVGYLDYSYGDEAHRLFPRGIEPIMNFEDGGNDVGMPVKTRYVSRGVQVFRYDVEGYWLEDGHAITWLDGRACERKAAAIAAWQPTALVFADYRKGICSRDLVYRLMRHAEANGIPVFVDTKPDAVGMYSGATLLKLNRHEAAAVWKHPIDDVDDARQAAADIARYSSFDNVVVTLDRDGLVAHHRFGDDDGCHSYDTTHVPALYSDPVDVTGAGDTTLAALVVSMLYGEPLERAAHYAARCAGEVVMRRGTVVATGGA